MLCFCYKTEVVLIISLVHMLLLVIWANSFSRDEMLNFVRHALLTH